MQEIGAWAPVLIQLLGCAAPSLDDPIGVGYLCLSNVAKMNKGENLNTDEVGATEAPLSAPQDDMALHNAKNQFDHIPPWRFKRARAATNPWEKLGSGPFVNRSAMKLVNLDAALGLIEAAQRCVSAAAANPPDNSSTLNAVLDDAIRAPFSEDEDEDEGLGGVMASLSGNLNFVDLCGAPGGFSEYLLWRGAQRGEPTRGFGISLGCDIGEGDPCAWKIGEQSSKCVDGSDSSNLNTFEICWGADGTGDLYSRLNIEHFVAHVLAAIDTANKHGDGTSSSSNASSSSSSSRGVALAVADGGFAAARDSHDQEVLMSRLVAAECLCALGCLALGGTFVVKMFETRTEATLGLVTHLALSFHRVALIKPVTSRPASSERYLLCEGLLFHRGSAAMKKVMAHLWAMHAGDTPLANEKAAPQKCDEIKPETATSLDQGSASTPLGATAVAAVDGDTVHPSGTFSGQVDYASARRHTATFLRSANARLGASQLAACEAILAHAHRLGHASKRKVSGPQASSWVKSSSISLPSGFGSPDSQISDGNDLEGPSHPSTHVGESGAPLSARSDGVQEPQAMASTSTHTAFLGSRVTALESDQNEEAATPVRDDQANTRERRSSRCLSCSWFRIQALHRTREHVQWETAGNSSSTLNSTDGGWADCQPAARHSDKHFEHHNIVVESTRVNSMAQKRKRARKNKKRAQERASREGNGRPQPQLSDDEAELECEARG